VTRGVTPEYLVALALDSDISGVRNEWAAYVLITPSGVKNFSLGKRSSGRTAGGDFFSGIMADERFR